MQRSFNGDREEGFSLVELLVVIVIIGILSAIAIAAFMNQRQKAAEASLKADLRTVSTHVTTELMDKDAAEMKTIFEDHRAAYVTNDHEGVLLTSKEWNTLPELLPLTISEGNMIEISILPNALGEWTKGFEQGEYCLAGTNPNTKYNYVPGSGKAAEYDKYLFYDARAGGMKTMDELLEIEEAGQEISCEGYVVRYKAANA